MLRKGQAGQLLFYVAKKDLETEVSTVQFDAPDRWGGVLSLKDGSRYFVDPLPAPPKLPQTVEARRLDPGDNP